MTIYHFQAQLSRRLLNWAMVSAVSGVAMALGGAFWRGVGSQHVGWAAVNAAIAVFGGMQADRKLNDAAAQAPTTRLREANQLRALLWINAGLDVLYMLGGWLWMRRAKSAFGRGGGLGVIVQGAFLCAFDIVHALRVPVWLWGGDPR